MIITNERVYGFHLMRDNVFNSKRDINVLTKYLYNINKLNEQEIIDYINNNMETYNEELIPTIIEWIVKNTMSYNSFYPCKLLDNDIEFDVSSLNFIKTYSKSKNLNQLLFVIWSLSKIYNDKPFYCKKVELIRMARLPEDNYKYFDGLMYKLYESGLIEYKVKNYKKQKSQLVIQFNKPTLSNSPTALTMTSLNYELILYYLNFISPREYLVDHCSECGSIFHKYHGSKHRGLCSDCRGK